MKKYIESERVSLFEPNVYIEFMVQITGNPKIEDLTESINNAFKANEVTMSKVVLEEDGTAYYERMHKSGCKVSVSKKNYIELIREQEKIPFEINKGEFIRVFIIPGEANISLLIIAHHLCGDGLSIMYFLEDIMKSLEGKALDFKEMKLITKESLPKKIYIPFFYSLFAKNINKKWNKNSKCFTWKDYNEIHKTYWSKNESNLITQHFSIYEVDKLKSKSKSYGVTLNSLILTAFIEANREIKSVGLAVNIRENKNKSMSNQASGISIDYSYLDKLSFEENALKLHKKINNKLKNAVMKYFILKFIPLFNPTLIDSMLMHTHGLYENKTTNKLTKVMGYTGRNMREFGITNLTKINIPSIYGKYKIGQLIFIPPVVSYAKHIVGVATLDDGMYITYHFMSNKDVKNEEEFFKRAIKNLKMI